jgi:hypothetical protein
VSAKPDEATELPAVGPPLEPTVVPHPCRTEDGGFDHDWKFQDESFDHEYGCEQVHFWRCERCDETRDMEDGDYDEDYS